MTKEELLQFLKDNLSINVDSNVDDGWLEIDVTLCLDNEVITSSSTGVSCAWINR